MESFKTLSEAVEYATRAILKRGVGRGENFVSMHGDVYEVTWGGPAYYPYPANSVVASVRFMPGGHVPAYKNRAAFDVPADMQPTVTFWLVPRPETVEAVSAIAHVVLMRNA